MGFAGRRVYLTGATGYVGAVILRRLREEGAEVTCLVRPGRPAGVVERLGGRVVRGDVTDPSSLDLSGHDLVIHAAAWVGFGIPPRKVALFRRTNVEGTRNVLEAAARAGVARAVHVSSVAALGGTGDTPATEASPRPVFYRSEYERTKTEAHKVALESSLPVAIPMPGLVVGGTGGPFTPVLRAVARGRVPALPGDDAVKGWVHVEDAAEGVLLCALKGKGPYLLVDENLRTTEVLVAALEEAGLPVPRRRFPSALLVGGAAAVEVAYRVAGRTPPVSRELLGSIRRPLSYDASRARKELGWRPDLVGRLARDLQALAR